MGNKYLNGDKLLPMTETAARDEYIRNMLAMELVPHEENTWNNDCSYMDDDPYGDGDHDYIYAGATYFDVGDVKLNTPCKVSSMPLLDGAVAEDYIVLARKINRGGKKKQDPREGSEREVKPMKHGYVVYGYAQKGRLNYSYYFMEYVWDLKRNNNNCVFKHNDTTVSLGDKFLFGFTPPKNYGRLYMPVFKRISMGCSKAYKTYLQRWVVTNKGTIYKGKKLYCRLVFVYEEGKGYRVRFYE